MNRRLFLINAFKALLAFLVGRKFISLPEQKTIPKVPAGMGILEQLKQSPKYTYKTGSLTYEQVEKTYKALFYGKEPLRAYNLGTKSGLPGE